MVDCFELGVFAQRQGDVFADGHGAEKGATLKRHAHFPADVVEVVMGDRGKIFAFEPDFAGAGLFEAHEGPQQSAFAGAGTAENDQGFAAIHVHGDAMENFAFAVANPQVAQRNHGLLVVGRWRHILRLQNLRTREKE